MIGRWLFLLVLLFVTVCYCLFPTSFWGSCFWLCTPGRRPSRPSPSVAFRRLPSPSVSHTQFSHAQLTALGGIGLHFVWQAWHLWRWAGSGGALGSRWRRGCLCGRCGIWKHRRGFSVAGLALGDIDFHFVWQAGRLATSAVCVAGV